MNAILATIAIKIGEYLWPKIEKLIRELFADWLPKILKTTIVGMAQAGGQLTVNTTDKVTDIIPGDIDDKVIDPIVKRGMDILRKSFGV